MLRGDQFYTVNKNKKIRKKEKGLNIYVAKNPNICGFFSFFKSYHVLTKKKW